MILKHRLERWVDAGLIDAGQAGRILAHEDERGRPRLLHAVVGLAGLAIAIGIVSIVASNWDVIPGGVKIAVDLFAVAGLSLLVVRLEGVGPAWAREAAILVLYGLILASIALIGQVYQLGGSARVALTTWTALTALLMTRARSAFVALVWLAALQTTWVTWLAWSAERPGELVEGLSVSGLYWAPLVCIAVGRTVAIERARPALARAFEQVGWAEIVLAASAATFAFYERADPDWRPGLWVGLLVAASLTAWIWATLGRSDRRLELRSLSVACLLLCFLALSFSPGKLEVVGAIAFIMLWLLVAYVAHRIGHAGLLNAATAVVGIRILVVYFEVFGSLLDTGIGLIVGGVLTLVLVMVWMRLRGRRASDPGRARS